MLCTRSSADESFTASSSLTISEGISVFQHTLSALLSFTARYRVSGEHLRYFLSARKPPTNKGLHVSVNLNSQVRIATTEWIRRHWGCKLIAHKRIQEEDGNVKKIHNSSIRLFDARDSHKRARALSSGCRCCLAAHAKQISQRVDD